MNTIEPNQLHDLLGQPDGYDAVTNTFFSPDQLLSHQLQLLCKGGRVVRYHTIDTLHKETVAAHSHGVAMLCWLIYTEGGWTPTMPLLFNALTHDLAECYVGDVPSPTKRALNVGGVLHEVEDAVLDSAGMVMTLSNFEGLVLQFADALQGLVYCTNEERLGNTGLRTVARNYTSYVKQKLQQLYNEDTRYAPVAMAAERVLNQVLHNYSRVIR